MEAVIKMRLKIAASDTSRDIEIGYWIDVVQNQIFNYCHIDVLPKMLEPLVIEKVVTLMRQQEETEQEIKSLSRGDTKIEYSSKSSIPSTLKGDVLSDVKTQLAPYRKCGKWRNDNDQQQTVENS